jgi:UDP-N-acetyl-D-glucosamine dehydrogenase
MRAVMPSKRRVVVVGQGYVGLPLAMRAVKVGYDVVGYDVNTDRIKALDVGESYVEDVSSAELLAAIETGRYRAVDSARGCAGFDIAVVTVPTPLREGSQTFPSSRSPVARWRAISVPVPL